MESAGNQCREGYQSLADRKEANESLGFGAQFCPKTRCNFFTGDHRSFKFKLSRR